MEDDDTQILADDYSKYLRVDTSDCVKVLEEAIDETLANLEDYGRIVHVMKSDSSVSVSAILTKKVELLTLFQKIRKLEFIVNVIKRNVDEIENLVITAETDLKVTTEGKLRHFLKNVIFKKRSEASTDASVSRNPIYFVQPNIFDTNELFNSTSLS